MKRLKTKKFKMNIANGGSAKDQMFCLGLQMKSKKFLKSNLGWWVDGWIYSNKTNPAPMK